MISPAKVCGDGDGDIALAGVWRAYNKGQFSERDTMLPQPLHRFCLDLIEAVRDQPRLDLAGLGYGGKRVWPTYAAGK